MLKDKATIQELWEGWQLSYSDAMAALRDDQVYYKQLTEYVKSTTGVEHYPDIDGVPQMQEKYDEENLVGLRATDFTIKNRDRFNGIKVLKRDIDDGSAAAVAMIRRNFQELGRTAALDPNELLKAVITAAPSTADRDTDYFLGDAHPLADGTTQSNIIHSGSLAANSWFIVDTRSYYRPFVYQEREAPKLVEFIDEKDECVAKRGTYEFIQNGRWAVGLSKYQNIVASNVTPSRAALYAAVSLMLTMKTWAGQPMGLNPDLLVCNENEYEAWDALINPSSISGTTNTGLMTKFKILVIPGMSLTLT